MSAAGRLETLEVVTRLVQNLTAQLVSKEDELRRRESSGGTYHDVAKMNRLRAEIPALERKLRRAEIAQDRELYRAE